jgi:hypothetical protein
MTNQLPFSAFTYFYQPEIPMGAASRYWKLVRIDAAGKRKVEEIAPAKAFFSSALPEFSAQSEVADTLVQRQLIAWMQGGRQEANASVPNPQLAERCLLCFISWHVEQVCWQLAEKFGEFHGFNCQELLPFVLDDDGRIGNASYKSLAREILHSFDPDQSSLATWTNRKVKHYPELNAFLLERGVYLVSDWAILNDTRPQQLERILAEFHHLTPKEIQLASQLLECYHAVYRRDRLQQRQAGVKGQCQMPTTAQLQAIASRLHSQHQQLFSPAQAIAHLQEIAAQLRQYRIYIRGGVLPVASLDADNSSGNSLTENIPAADGTNLSEPDEQSEFLQSYRQQFLTCLDEAVAAVIDLRVKHLEKDAQKAEQFILALQLFHCQERSMGEIAQELGLQAQYQVTRLLKLKEFRADVQQQLLCLLRSLVFIQAENYTSVARLQSLAEQIEAAIAEQITKVIAEAESAVHISKNRPTINLFAQRLCRYLDQNRS